MLRSLRRGRPSARSFAPRGSLLFVALRSVDVMSRHSAENGTDAAVLREVLVAVAGRPALAPVHAAASALLAEIDTEGEPGGSPSSVPPGDIPDVDVPHTTRPRIDQPLGDPLTGTTTGDPSSQILDAEMVDDNDYDNSLGIESCGSVSTASTGFTDGGVPTWDSVRDKVDNRTTTALGREELDRSTQAGRTVDEQWNAREAAGRSKLDEIRRSMKDDNPGS